MGKLPSFQFYPGDWLKDPQLRMASMSSKGIWIDLLCAMFEAKERGALEGTAHQFCKLLGCTRDEFDLFLSEARSVKFANVRDLSVECPQVIRIESRRMLRDENQRQTWGKQKRQQRHPENKVRESADCPPDVHAVSERSPSLSSSSSSSSKKDTPLPPQEGGPLTLNSVQGKNGGPKQKRKPASNYSPEFEQAIALYPRRPGDSKVAAYQAWRARLNEGVTPIDLLAGVKRYSAYVKILGTEPQFIKQASSFFGPKEFWKETWAVTNGNGKAPAALPPTYEELYGDQA
jgi:hypothetical protein